MSDLLYLDTETFSGVDLKKVGSYAYAEHPTTEVMIATYAFDDEPVKTWDATTGTDMPRDLRRALKRAETPNSKTKIVGANFGLFDRIVLRHCWDIDIHPSNIIDTMVVAFQHALPGSLATLCEVLNIDEDQAKDKAGKALIKRFCKPTPKNYKIRRYTRDTHPAEWEKFLSYARSDITSMRAVFKKIPTWGCSEFENRVWALDQLINDRGFRVDVALAEAAIDAVVKHKKQLQARAQEQYGGSLTGKGFLPILQKLAPAHRIHNAQKSTLNDLLADDDLPDEARTIIEMRLGASSTASTKYNPLLLGRSRDDRRRGCIQYGGAKRTLRFAGKGFQPQNLARGYYHDDPDKGEFELSRGIKLLLKGRAHRSFDISKLTASTVRGCIIPAEGCKFVVADYSNVEGRGLAWLAGEETALETFRAGLDIYCVTAGKMFDLDPDYIKAERKDLRQIGKACELGLGYSGGVAAFLQFAKVLGLNLSDMAATMDGTFPEHIWAQTARGYEWARIQEAKRPPYPGEKDERPSYILPKKVWRTCDAIKRMWREAHPETVQLWADIEAAAMSAIRNPGEEFLVADGKLKVSRNVNEDGSPGWWMRITLPSGRVMSYPGIGLSVTKEKDENGKVSTNVRIKYQGENQITRQWTTLYTYSGKLVENVVQAMCRDLLANALINTEEGGYPIVLHVHDEIVTEVPNTPEYNVATLERLMCELPDWAEGFPLVAEGGEMMRYAK